MTEIRFVPQGHEVIAVFRPEGGDPHNFVARVARTCYRSPRRGDAADRSLVGKLVGHGHTAMLEHSLLSVEIVTDRAIANEIVRHRHFSFAQESTRYVNYGNRGFRFVMPEGVDGSADAAIRVACRRAAESYQALLDHGVPAQVARSVLPLCTATTIVVTGNLTEWRHFFRLRTDEAAHPMMRSLAAGILDSARREVPVAFDDIEAGGGA